MQRLARRPAGGPRPAPAALARTSGRSSRAATRSARSATSPRGASGSTPRPTSASTGVAEVAERRRRGRAHAGRTRTGAAGGPDDAARARPRRSAAIVLGDGIARRGRRRGAAPARGAPRDPRLRARGLGGGRRARSAAALAAAGWPVETVHAARRARPPSACRSSRTAASELARLRVERDEPLVAIGGGALGDAAGFLAATYLRGIPFIHVPTTLVAQIDSSIGGKTAVDLPEGKNLVGAFHQPAAIVIDVGAPRDAPRAAAAGRARRGREDGRARRRAPVRAARDGRRRRSRAATRGAVERGAVAELVERARWAKVEVVAADERERGPRGGRITPQPGPLARARRRGRGRLRRPAPRRGRRVRAARGRAGSAWRSGSTPPERAARIDAPARRARSRAGAAALRRSTTVLDHLATDKKHAGGRLRWVLPTADGVEVRADVPDEVVRDAAGIAARRRERAT